MLFLLILMVTGQTSATPFLYNPQALTSWWSSASATSSGPLGNIANLRQTQIKPDDDDFFKEPIEVQNEASPGLIQKKIDKIVQKIRFLTTLANSGKPSNENDVPKEQDDFDKEFDAVGDKQDLVAKSGYSYNKPAKLAKNGDFNPANIGVFFMELVGSLVGLAYGAAAQLNLAGTTAAPP